MKFWVIYSKRNKYFVAFLKFFNYLREVFWEDWDGERVSLIRTVKLWKIVWLE